MTYIQASGFLTGWDVCKLKNNNTLFRLIQTIWIRSIYLFSKLLKGFFEKFKQFYRCKTKTKSHPPLQTTKIALQISKILFLGNLRPALVPTWECKGKFTHHKTGPGLAQCGSTWGQFWDLWMHLRFQNKWETLGHISVMLSVFFPTCCLPFNIVYRQDTSKLAALFSLCWSKVQISKIHYHCPWFHWRQHLGKCGHMTDICIPVTSDGGV